MVKVDSSRLEVRHHYPNHDRRSGELFDGGGPGRAAMVECGCWVLRVLQRLEFDHCLQDRAALVRMGMAETQIGWAGWLSLSLFKESAETMTAEEVGTYLICSQMAPFTGYLQEVSA